MKKPGPPTRFISLAALACVCAVWPAPSRSEFVLPVTVIKPGDMERKEREQRKLCRTLQRNASRLKEYIASSKIDSYLIASSADHFSDGSFGCKEDISLAIALIRAITLPDALAEPNKDDLADLSKYLRKRGSGEDVSDASEIEQMLWLRGYSRPYNEPKWTPQNLREFMNRDDVWAFLGTEAGSYLHRQLRYDILLDHSSKHFDPASAVALMEQRGNPQDKLRAARILLDNALLPSNPARAEALLIDAAKYDEEAANMITAILAPRLSSADVGVRESAFAQLKKLSLQQGKVGEPGRALLTPILTAELKSSDVATRMKTADTLTQYTVYNAPNSKEPLYAWVNRTISQGDEQEKSAARNIIAALIKANVAGADQLLVAAAAKSGGIVDGGTLEASKLSKIFMEDDYPPRALREKLEGIVEGDIVVTPEGRVVQLTIERSFSPDMDDRIHSIMMSRLRARNLPPLNGRFVRFRLPLIQFRLPSCDGKTPPTAQVEGALVIDGICLRRDI